MRLWCSPWGLSPVFRLSIVHRLYLRPALGDALAQALHGGGYAVGGVVDGRASYEYVGPGLDGEVGGLLVDATVCFDVTGGEAQVVEHFAEAGYLGEHGWDEL